ncbi:uncharacterized protein yc1106_00077 [Curvularia clavata]|uniref:Peptide hydrolase n=1 Tax=Curvularia clavata TaxID=95742 RepID=A0A9Q9DMV4_CURCL|nr:uncharacterized protein yc1106_00077 [Curvularia clavata]
MRHSVIFGALAATASANSSPAVNPTLLKADISRDNLLAGSQKLQSLAYATNEKNRMVSRPGHVATIDWIKQKLEALDYYHVLLQPFWVIVEFSSAVNAFAIGGKELSKSSYSLFQYSPGGKVAAPLMIVEGGCNKTDYPADLAGKIAIISRGTCDFGTKSAFAGSVGAAGLILYNIDETGPVQGTLLAPPRPEGPYVPTLNVIRNVSTPIVAALKRGENITASFDIFADIRNITTNNVIATTKSGDQNNKLVLGAHTDSVAAGPGINDDGSGINALLEVARALSKYSIKNAVTFGFWSAEEIDDRPGSSHFVKTLSAADNAKIRAYLNFDMIASPNYVNAIYDGDGKVFGTPGPTGSAELQNFYQNYFKAAGKNFTATAFDGRSDYQPFLDADIPCGGTFTGAEQNKTAEEVVMFGGKAGVPYDSCYHQACDTVDNLNMDAFMLHTKGIAEAVATFATSWDGFPQRAATSTAKRNVVKVRSSDGHGIAGGCSHNYVAM